MFSVPVKGMDPNIRRRAKAINFGIVYGISAFGLADQLGIPREEASAYIKRYFERFPGIRAYMDETKRRCRERGYVTTLFGRVCHYPDITVSNPSQRAAVERQAINAPIQGSAADIIRRAMARMDAALSEARLSARMLLQVHDELVFEAPARGGGCDDPGDPPHHGGGAVAGSGVIGAAGGGGARRQQLGRGALTISIGA